MRAPTRHRPYWKAWLAFAGCAGPDVAAIATGNVTAIVVAGCATVTATGAVFFGPSNVPTKPKG